MVKEHRLSRTQGLASHLGSVEACARHLLLTFVFPPVQTKALLGESSEPTCEKGLVHSRYVTKC